MGYTTMTAQMLRENPDWVFVFGDNTLGTGYGGAAALRDEPNAYGFITKIYPDDRDGSFFTPADYVPVYLDQMQLLIERVRNNPFNTFFISKLGSGLANKFHIFEQVIAPTIKVLLAPYPNVEFLWD